MSDFFSRFTHVLGGMKGAAQEVIEVAKEVKDTFTPGHASATTEQADFDSQRYSDLSAAEKQSYIKTQLNASLEAKQKNPAIFKEYYTPKLFDKLVGAYIAEVSDAKGAFGSGDEYPLFNRVITEHHGNIRTENYTKATAALIAGMQLKNPDEELLMLMSQFEVGAEQKHINITEAKVSYIDSTLGGTPLGAYVKNKKLDGLWNNTAGYFFKDTKNEVSLEVRPQFVKQKAEAEFRT